MKARRNIFLVAMLFANIALGFAAEYKKDTVDLCPGDTLHWYEHTITEGGDYVHKEKSVVIPDEDSIIHQRHVIKLPEPKHVDEYENVCSNKLETFRWHGMKFTEGGVYTYKKPGTCDTIHVLHLTVLPTTEDSLITTYYCIADGYNHKSTHYTKEQTFVEVMTNRWGCDSMVTYEYKALPYYSFPKLFQHHKDSAIHVVFNDSVYTQDGRYYQHYRSKDDCDSVYEITVATQYDNFYSIVKCEGMTVKHGTQIIDSTCTIIDSLKTILGADSLLHFNYSFRRPFYDLDTAYICEGDSFIWDGHLDRDSQVIVLREPGLHRDEHRLVGSDCDSIHELFLIVGKRWLRDSTIIMCNDSLAAKGGKIVWHDHWGLPHVFARPNLDTVIYDTLQYTSIHPVEGWPGQGGSCDSILKLHVIITDRCSELEQIPMCRCKGYAEVDGIKYTKPGIYSTKWPSSRGLNLEDSLHRFELYWEDNDTTIDNITICQSKLPINYNDGKQYTKTGDYIARFINRHGCDSIVKLHVDVIPTKYSPWINYPNFCPGDDIHIEIGDSVFTKPGDYTYTVPYGTCQCDSVIRIHITTKYAQAPTYDTVYIRPGGSYTWKGHKGDITYTQPGNYYDSILNASKCYEIYRLTVKEAPSYYIPETLHVCTQDSAIEWHGKYITKDTVLYDSLKTIYNMDSIYVLTARLYPAYTVHKTHTLCYGDYIEIEGKRYNTSRTVKIVKHTTCGCDSVVLHQINVLSETKFKRDSLYCAEGQTVTWRNKTYNTTGDYTDTVRSTIDPTHLCDSMIFHLHLEVVHPFMYKDSTTLCKNFEPFDWHGQLISHAGIYTDTVSTKVKGINSIYVFKVDTLPTFFTSTSVKICEGNSYNFDGELITQPGTYVHRHKAQNDCDSTVRCIVNYAPHYHFYDEVITYVSDNELPLTWPGHTKLLTGEGYFYDSLQTVCCGCDSIHRVHVVKTQSYLFEDTKTVCDCQLPFKWHDILIQKGDTTYTKIYTSSQGRDSIYQLTVKVNPTDSVLLRTQLCVGATYDFHGKKITEPGVYRDTFLNQYFCDSIIILSISRPQTDETIVSHTLCAGQSISIDGKEITQSGIYYETKRSMDGCDSILRHVVDFIQPFYQTETKTINEGEIYTWHGQSLTEGGTYFDRYKTVLLGCDSIYRLQLTVNKEQYNFVEKVTVCQSELPYIWHQHSFTRDTTCQIKLKTHLGKDSIYTLDLTVIRLRDSIAYYNNCDGESVTIDGVEYSKQASFTKTYKGSHGCDSVRIKYILNFFPRYSLTQLKELKGGESYHFGEGTPLDTVIRTTGTYTRHFTSIYGCDSTVTLIVTACPNTKIDTVTVNMCKGDTYILDGERITQSTAKTRINKNIDGCDSITYFNIRFEDPITTTKNVAICSGGSYRWTNRIGHRNDTILTEQGVYTDSVLTPTGCYETSTLILTFKSTNSLDTTITLCRDKLPYEVPFLQDGKKHWEDSIFIQKLGITSHGCDSIRRWRYQINNHCSAYDTYYRCSNEPKYIEGLIITKQGTYAVNRLTEQGEDSLYRFRVLDVQPYETYTYQPTACDSTVYNNKTYYTRGEGKETFVMDFHYKSVDGCDSIEHRTFTIGSASPKHVQHATIADYEKYRFEGQDYNVPGTYQVKHFNRHGCDSIEELQLTVLTTQYPDPLSYSFCAGDRTGLEIFGKLYFPTGDTIISDTIRSGGLPVIRTAVVKMYLPFKIAQFNPQNDQLVCADNKVSFEVTYSVKDKGALPEYYEVEFMVGDLDIEPRHATYPVNGKTVLPIEMDGKGTSVNPGYYAYRIKLGSEICAYSDTTFTGTVLVRYPANIMKANWSNVITLIEEDYNVGHWSLQAPYAWQVKNSVGEDKSALVVPDNNAQPYIVSNNLRDGDEVVATLYRADYYRPIPSCPFIFHPVQANNYQHPVLVYPTAAPKRTAVHIQTEQQGKYQLYYPTGSRYHQGELQAGDNLINLPSLDGCYLIKVITNDGSEALERVIVY